MIDLITSAASTIPQTLADAPALTCLIIVSLQLALIAAVAQGVTAWIAKGNAASVYPVWLIAITASATLIPLHLLTSGWTLPFAVAAGQAAAAASIDRIAEPVDVASKEHESVAGESIGIVDAISDAPSEDKSPPAVVSLADRNRGKQGITPSGRMRALGVSEREPPIPASSLATAPLRWTDHAARLVSGILAIVYVSGLLIFAVRMIRGLRRLRDCARRGRCLSRSGEAERLARSLGLSRSPTIRVTDRIAMPMVFGLRCPIVLVPEGFDGWDATERRATLLHEFTHIRRRDMVGQWMSRWVRAIYWFHPAAWLMDRRLAEAREWATDREVVDGEADAIGYARSLLAVVTRLNSRPPDRMECTSTAIAMSSHHDLHRRLNHILGGTAKRSLQASLAKPVFLVILFLLIAATTFHLEPVAAQRNASSGNAGSENQTQPPANGELREDDLISRVQHCDVLTVTGDEFDAIFDVSGRVTDPEGNPIAGATVVLRESSTMRLSAEYQKFFDNEHRTLQRTQDVFARTRTNERGEFRIENARSPALPKHWSNSWRGDVVAAHSDHGLGWEFLGDKQEIHRVESGLTIVLHPTAQVSGTYQTPAGTPVVGAEVRCADLSKPQSERRTGHNLDLQNSQLAPLSLSDENGGFRLDGLPPGYRAIVTMWHSDWPMTSAAIATSADVADEPSRGTGYEVSATLTSPATVIADPGVVIRGRVVDSQGNAIEHARVSRSSSTLYEETDSEGRYELRFTNRALDRDRDRNDGESKIYVRPPEESDLLGLYATVRVDDVIDGKPADFELQRGFRVTGEVVDAQGKPLEGIVVGSVPYDYSDGRRGSRTDSEGKYWSVLPAGGHLLAVATDQPGFAVPTYLQFRRATRDDAEAWTHQWIGGEVGQTVTAERFTVDRVQPIQVIVSLPDGKPAVGATAVLQDKAGESAAPGGGQLPGRFEVQSDAVMTNSAGRASLIPRGALSTDGRVTVKLATTDEAYFASAKLSQAVDGVVNVVLDRAQAVVGRVLVDGKGVPGARVNISQTQPYRRSVNGRTVMASLGTHFASVTTDGDGWYRAAVQPDSNYSVSVQSLPNSTMHPGIGFSPVLDEDGNLRVREFEFFSGDAEIAGRVIDRDGQPVKGARVQIGRTSAVNPSLWMGHQSESQFETDEKGFFHLARVPSGSYALRVYQPRSNDGRPNMPIQLNVQTGTMDVEAILDTTPGSQPRRLEPKKIIPIQ